MSFLNSPFPAVVNTTDFDLEMYNRICDGLTDLTAYYSGISDTDGNITLGASDTINWPSASFSWSSSKVQTVNLAILENDWSYGTLTPPGNANITGDINVDSGASMTLSGNLSITGKIDVNTVTGASMTIEQVAEPDDPEEGKGVLWCSNGTGAGDVGDIMVKINYSTTVKTTTLVDFV